MDADGRRWIAALPAELDGQRAVLTGLLDRCEADDTISWLVIGCSLARGAADRLSDLDLALGVRDEDFGAAAARIRPMVDGLGRLVESYHHQLPEVTGPHERIFAQFADGAQVDLVVFPESEPVGSFRTVVLLYRRDAPADAGGQAGDQPADPRPAPTPGQIREWAFRGWCALADLTKYLRRGSAWEALERLHEARTEFWRVWAVAHDVPDPQYGITSILDFAAEQVPPELGRTVADLDLARLLTAARHLAARFAQLGDDLDPDQAAALPYAMASYITGELAALAAAPSS
jgi:hypothetical protein